MPVSVSASDNYRLVPGRQVLGLQDVLDHGDDMGVRGGRGGRLPGILHPLPGKEGHEASSVGVLVLRLAGWNLHSAAVVVDGPRSRLHY